MGRRAAALVLALGLAACAAPKRRPLGPDGVLAGFRGVSPALAEAVDGAAAVAVFPDVEWTAEGCVHAGVLVRADGAREPVLLRCTSAPRAPAGYADHRLVVVGDAATLAGLANGPLPLADFTRLHVDEIEPGATLIGAPGWVVSTRRPHLLFPDESPEQQLERAQAP